MSTIVTRAGKGSALTWTEGDANITNLNTDKLEHIVSDLTPQLGGALDVNGFAITSTSNSNIEIAPNGTGDVLLTADTVRVGDASAAATITTNGTGNLTISTNGGTNSMTMVFANGANGNLTVTPNGTGAFIVSGPNVGVRTNSNGGSVIGRVNTTTTGTYLYPGLVTNKNRTDILTAAMTNEPAVIGFSVRDSALVTTNFGRLACTYQGTGTNPFFRFSQSADGFSTEVVSVVFGGGVANWGSAGTYTHTTTGTTDLILSTNGGTNSGTITINDGVNGNIAITPNGTGAVDFGATRPGSKIQYRRTYGCFHKMADVTAAAADTVYAFDWTTDVTAHVNTQGVTVSNTSRLNIDAAGEYTVDLEMHAQNTDNADRAAFVWLAKNGTDLAETCIKVVLTKDTSTVIAKSWLVEGITAGQYLEVRFAVDNTSGISLQHEAALSTPYVRPAVASATITISPVGA